MPQRQPSISTADLWRILLSRCGSYVRKGKRDADLEEELSAHIAFATEENLAAGMTPQQARTAALRSFGGLTQTRETYRQQRGLPMLELLNRDIRFAVRQLMRSPGFTITTVLTLALGIGISTAIFSMMQTVVVHPLAIPDLNRVLAIAEEQGRGEYKQVTLANYLSWKQQSRSFEDMAVRSYNAMSMTGAGEALHVQASNASVNFFSLLQIHPLLGRAFQESEGVPGRNNVVMLNYGFWQKHFGGDSAVLGRTIDLDERAYTIVGVLPRTAQYPSTADVFLPLAPTSQEWQNRTSHDYLVIGRLKAGVTIDQAQTELRLIAKRLEEDYPATNPGWSVRAEPLLDNVVGTMTPVYYSMVLAATGFLLLVVCANIANLQFVRGLARRSEIAVRIALGAGRGRLLRHLLTESILLGLMGAAGGLVVAWATMRISVATMPERVARYIAGWSNISLDGKALAYSLLLALVAGLASGLLPSLRSLRVNLADELKSGSRTTSGNRQTHRLRDFFAMSQIALSVLLVIGAALMSKGMWAMLHFADPYQPRQTLTFNVSLPASRYGGDEKLSAWFQKSLEQLRNVPGVKHAEITTALPEGQDGWVDNFQIENRPLLPGQFQSATHLTVSAGYFDALHIKLLSGRTFAHTDTLQSQPVAVISRRLAERYFPSQDAIGRRIQVSPNSAGPVDPATGKAPAETVKPWVRIVGVVDDVNYSWIDRAVIPAVYLNVAQMPLAEATYVITTDGDPHALIPGVRSTLTAIDAAVPLDALQTYQHYLTEAFTGLLYVAVMLSVDAFIGLLLAAIGIFGVMANVVAERTREIGVRMAMGANPRDMVKMIMRRAGLLAGCGIALGAALAAVMARLSANFLFGVRPDDPLVFGAIILAVAAITLLACLGPARRAASVDPMRTLRAE
jgi:putative ABC transport system permease protein